MTLQGDIFKSSATGETTTFDQAFPTIVAIDVDIDETGEGNQGLGRRSLRRRSVREMINCSNPRCHGKGFDLGSLIRELAAQQRTALKIEKSCQSREENGRPCPNRFQIKIHIIYKAL